MSRTRCVQFYWRKYCRLVKYYKCVEACRLIKARYKRSVERIERQYRFYRLRRRLDAWIRDRQVRLLQRALRKVLQKKRADYYE